MIVATFRSWGFKIKGHADYADPGSDIVCAGVSALLNGTLLALDGMPKDNILIKEHDDGSVTLNFIGDARWSQRVAVSILFQGVMAIESEHPEHLDVRGVWDLL